MRALQEEKRDPVSIKAVSLSLSLFLKRFCGLLLLLHNYYVGRQMKTIVVNFPPQLKRRKERILTSSLEPA